MIIIALNLALSTQMKDVAQSLNQVQPDRLNTAFHWDQKNSCLEGKNWAESSQSPQLLQEVISVRKQGEPSPLTQADMLDSLRQEGL